MGFSEAVRTCLKLKYATFEGRAARSEYWYFMLFVLLVAVVLGGLAGLMMGASGFQNMQNGGSMPVASMILFGILGIFYLGILLPSIFVGFIASIAAFVITCLKGTEGPNKFGRDPLGVEHSADVFN